MLSGWGAWGELLRGMWDLPGPGREPTSPALAGRSFTTEPLRKPWNWIIYIDLISCDLAKLTSSSNLFCLIVLLFSVYSLGSST